MRHAVDPRLRRGNTPLPRPTAAVPSILATDISPRELLVTFPPPRTPPSSPPFRHRCPSCLRRMSLSRGNSTSCVLRFGARASRKNGPRAPNGVSAVCLATPARMIFFQVGLNSCPSFPSNHHSPLVYNAPVASIVAPSGRGAGARDS